MTGIQLKNSILQEAIEGRLVPQDPNNEPASVLLDRIRDEKAKLVKEKKIKKDKNESRIYRSADGHWMERFTDKKRPDVCIDEEIPFDIPETWQYTRMSFLISLLSGRDLQPKDYQDKEEKGTLPYITGASNFINGNLIKNRWTKNPVTISHKGDLLITCKGTIGSMAFNDIGDLQIARQVMAIFPYFVELKYIKVFIEFNIPSLERKAVSMIPGISRKDMLSLIVPLPPLAEQHRIVEKLEQILPKVEEYGKAQERLDTLNAELPEKLKTSILQEAIEGRLVPQDPNDEPAAVLLDRIRDEKAKLVKEKKIKKDKNESRIYRSADGHWMERFTDKKRPDVCIDDEIPFDIPETWEWCRIGSVFSHTSGKQQSSSNKKGGTPQKFITTSNLYWGYFILDQVKVMNFTDYEIETCSATKGDLLVCEGGAGFGRSAIWDKDYDICLQNHIHRLRPYKSGDLGPYVFYLIRFLKECSKLQAVGTAMPGLSANRLKAILIPLPPLAEQHRIVEKLESILPMLDAFKKR